MVLDVLCLRKAGLCMIDRFAPYVCLTVLARLHVAHAGNTAESAPRRVAADAEVARRAPPRPSFPLMQGARGAFGSSTRSARFGVPQPKISGALTRAGFYPIHVLDVVRLPKACKCVFY